MAYVVTIGTTMSSRLNTCAIKNWVCGASHQNILANWWGLFAGLFAINAWFNIFVAATYLPVRLTPKIFHLNVSHRKFLANRIVLYKNRQTPVLFLRIWNFVYIFRIVYACVRIRNGGFCESRRHICRSYNLQPHQQRCANKISHQKPHPSWRRYTFLSHLTTKSKISVRWIKKLVAATYGVYIFIHKSSLSHS